MWFKKNKWKIIVLSVIAAVLAFAFWYGGDAPDSRGWVVESGEETDASTGTLNEGETVPKTDEAVSDTDNADAAEPEREKPAVEKQETGKDDGLMPEHDPEPEHDTQQNVPDNEPEADPEPEKNKNESTDPTPEQEAVPDPTPETDPEPEEEQTVPEPEQPSEPEPKPEEDTPVQPAEPVTLTCTISVSCATILNNMDLCDEDKRELVPADGWILSPVTVEYNEGESVFNILLRTLKLKRIHMEYSMTPGFESAYVEGIANIYEFDVGELSGWKYSVNGWFPGYSSSNYILQPGDVIEWKYTCDQGVDIGSYFSDRTN